MKNCLVLLFLAFTLNAFSQDFLQPSGRFTKKTTSYFYLKDGSEVEGTIDDIDRKKGLIEEVEIYVNGDKKNKRKLKPADINYMYLMPSKIDKLANVMEDMTDVQSLNADRTVDIEKINEGYVLFESTEVMLKKKNRTLLLQLLNPAFAKNIRVYYDPYARESASVGIGGMTLAGGHAKSYFVKVGEGVATKIKKKNYDDHVDKLFKNCSDLKRKYKNLEWKTFNKHIILYNEKCSS